MKHEPLTTLMKEVPASVLEKTTDEVMIDYAISCVKDQQSQTSEQAISNIQNMKRLRDAFKKASMEGWQE